MANIIIKINKEDVETAKIGNNFMLKCKNNIDLIFTPEAIEELFNDVNSISKNEKVKLNDT